MRRGDGVISGGLESRLQPAALDLLAVASLPQCLAFVQLLISRECGRKKGDRNRARGCDSTQGLATPLMLKSS